MTEAPIWTPLGLAARRAIERAVIRNPHFAEIWIKHDPTAIHALARLGIPIHGGRP